MKPFLVTSSLAALLLLASSARSQSIPFLGGAKEPAEEPAPVSADAQHPEEPAPDSPRRSVAEFLDLTRDGKLAEASRHVVAPRMSEADRMALTQQLKEVLDRRLWIDVEAISGSSQGDRDDGLPPNVEELGSIPLQGREIPVRLVKVPGEGRWAFSAALVASVPALYDALPDRWIREHLPAWLLRMGPRDLAWWQWAALVPLALLSWLGGRILAWITCSILTRIAKRTRAQWDDRLSEGLHGPLVLAWAVVVARVLLPSLALPIAADRIGLRLLVALATASLFWAAWRSVDVLAGALATLPWAARNASALNLLRVGSNMAKGVAAVLGLLAVLSGLGLPVATLIAGVGLGSLALAFGAQRTVENVFGSIALAVDQPFRVGDFVKVEDFTGTVENIGLRSTRFRTLDRTIVTIPNGLVANMRLETYAARDRMRLFAVLGLVLETPRHVLVAVLAGWEAVLRRHPHAWPDGISVRLAKIAESSLDVEVAAWFATPDWGQFQGFRQEVLLDFLEVAEREGASLAYPTRTVILSTQAPPSPAPHPQALLPPSTLTRS